MNQEKAKQLTEKLLKSPAGREVLGKHLNIDLMTKQEAESVPELATIAVLVPCYHSPEPMMADSLSQVYNYCREHKTCNIYSGPHVVGSSVVHWSRNYLVAELIKSQKPWTHILFWDDDIVCTPNLVERLLAHGKDIVGAVCTKRTDPPVPNVRFWDEEIKGFRGIFDWPRNQLIEVGGIGTGIILISRTAMEQVADAYFTCKYEREVFQITEALAEKIMEERLRVFDDTANASWFRFLPDLKGASEFGEDMSFCLMAKRYCNIPIYADTAIRPKHIGKYGFSVDDYEPYKDQVLEKAKAEGNYRPMPGVRIELPAIEVIG